MSEYAALQSFLDAQRGAVLDIVAGLGEHDMTRTTVPSGWTPDSLLRHLADAEHYWFGVVMARAADVRDDAKPAPEVYLAQTRECTGAIDGVALDTPTVGPVVDGLVEEITTLREVMLHMIEETARHAGHLDIARELIDGRTGRGHR